MPNWHGYILLEKTVDLNQANFDTLCNSFATLPPVTPVDPQDFMATRINLDTSARLFEMRFDTEQIELQSFKQYMADLFNVDVANVGDEIVETVSYSGLPDIASRRWGFRYPLAGARRLEVVRFGQGADWFYSQAECYAYVHAILGDWE